MEAMLLFISTFLLKVKKKKNSRQLSRVSTSQHTFLQNDLCQEILIEGRDLSPSSEQIQANENDCCTKPCKAESTVSASEVSVHSPSMLREILRYTHVLMVLYSNNTSGEPILLGCGKVKMWLQLNGRVNGKSQAECGTSFIRETAGWLVSHR